MAGTGTREDPWQLTTANGGSAYTMWRDEAADPPVIVCMVGTTKLTYHLQAIGDLHAWLKAQGDWVDLGGADEQKPAADGTVEAWGRAEDNPVGGWYGTRKLHRLEENLGAADLELSAEDLAEITSVSDAVDIEGARYPEHLERLTGR